MIWIGGVAAFLLFFALAYPARRTPFSTGNKANSPTRWRSPKSKFNVATFNVQSGKGLDGVRDITRSVKLLKGIDIAGIQELRAATWLGRHGHLETIATLLDLGWLFSATRKRWFREFQGNGLLTAFPIVHWERRPLIDKSGHSYRNLTIAKILVGEKPLWVLNTHLHRRIAREQQLEEVLEAFGDLRPAILFGDLNTRPTNPKLRSLFTPDTADAINIALGDDDPQDRIDWIITRGLKVHSGRIAAPGISDHPCYTLEVSFV